MKSQRPPLMIVDDMESDSTHLTIEKMEKYGGSFVKALAQCARRADPINLKKIKNTWPEYWAEYSRDI